MKTAINESKLASFIYRNLIESRGPTRRCWHVVRKITIKLLGDPSCMMKIHEKSLFLPLSHLLPVYLDSKPLYDRIPREISKFLLAEGEEIVCIDVGANIGDTVAAFMTSPRDKFLAIEPNPHFARYFRENWRGNDNVVLLSVICSSSVAESNVLVEEQQGTARIVEAKNGEVIKQTTLDETLRTMPEFNKANLLKIDTDGYDFQIIQGASSFITRNQPVVLFECDGFENQHYLDDFFSCMEIFRKANYESLVLYDHHGYMMGRFYLESADFQSTLGDLLRWQQETKKVYFDVLLMREDKMNLFCKRNHQSATVSRLKSTPSPRS